MQPHESRAHCQSAEVSEVDSYATLAPANVTPAPQQISTTPGMERLPGVDDARRRSFSISKPNGSRGPGSKTLGSEIAVSQSNHLSGRSDKEYRTEGTDFDCNNLGGNDQARHCPTLVSRSCIKSDASVKTFALRHHLPGNGGANDEQVQGNVDNVKKSVFSVDRPAAFDDRTRVFHNFHDQNVSQTAAVTCLTEAEATVPSALYSEMDAGAKRCSGESEKFIPPLRQQLGSLSEGERALCHRGCFTSSTALIAGHTSSHNCVQVELPGTGRGSTLKSGNIEEAKVSSSHTAFVSTSRLLDTSVVTEDATHSRKVARALREMLSISDRDCAGFSTRHEGDDSPKANSTAAVENPVHRNIASRVGDNDGSTRDTHCLYGNENPGAQSSTTQEELHARSVSNGAGGGGGGHYKTDGLGDGLCFASYRGELEWLQVPSLFYLFANIIKWNELQLQRRESQVHTEESHSRLSNASFSLVSIWTQNRERELRTLEGRISFAIHELQGVYLNPLLVGWSKPKLRSLVADVASIWGKKGPYSPEFSRVSGLLFDAISKEQSCQLRSTCLLSVRQWLGDAQHRWTVTCLLMTLLSISILCIAFLTQFRDTQVILCIALLVLLGVAAVLMSVIALFVLHHNTYADTAAKYFREEAVRTAQQKMEEEELEEEGGDGSMGTNGHLAAVRAHRNAAVGGGRGGHRAGDNHDIMGAEDEYMENEISLAVRNLRALTEGRTHPDPHAPPYHSPSNQPQNGKRGGGRTGYSFFDGIALGDENDASLNSRSLQTCDPSRKQIERNPVKSAYLGCVTFEQKQRTQIGHHHAHVAHERVRPPEGLHSGGHTMQNGTDDTTGVQGRRTLDDSCVIGNEDQLARGVREGHNIMGPVEQRLPRSIDLRENVNVTVVVFCSNVGVLSQVAPSLWERNFMVLCVTNFDALVTAVQQHSERCRVILICALDVAEGSPALGTALLWRSVENRPVFFFSFSPTGYPASVPLSARLLVPFSLTVLNTLYLVGIGVGADLGCISFPALLQGGGGEAREEEQRQDPSPSQPFQVPPYTLGRRLGGGAFGNVFEAEMEHTGAKCAVKRMYLKEDSAQDEEQQVQPGSSGGAGARAMGSSSLTTGVSSTTPSPGGEAAGTTEKEMMCEETSEVGTQLREIAQEVEIMSSLQHPNIVRYYYCERDDNCISIFMELCTGGSLRSLIHSGKLVNPPEIKLLLREIISAVSYLHNMRIVHRDLKPDNVLFRQGHIKITDFGTAVHKHGGDLRLLKGTFAYMAPEILVGDPYGRACDVWSIGCIAAEVLSVELPQHALGLPEMCEYYRAMGENSELPIECDVPGVRDFLLACLQRNPNERSTAAELFYHPILQPRDTSIHAWMVEVVARHRRTQRHQQQQTFHRNGLSGRTGTGASGAGGGNHHASSKTLNNSGGVEGAHIGEGFDLHSDGGDAESLDSSQLMGQPPPPDSELTASARTERSC
ncbi:hypothetical protein JKF63_07593 [Porcisia hertigi]|uniref:Protein kinase domain-containing protein n=1 Tax=Porcisia hertigi TaxID=2761500 RepID=A0A836LM71_9TRYP|nr:hypothetical protein JKF63_07593 [Porcisia hertigi]